MAREKITADIIEEAVYRYVASRDDLLTRLIVDAYDALGEVVEHSVAASRGVAPIDRWVHAAHEVREWSINHPHEYFLLYGTPVPGYAAPEMTGISGTRATRALATIITEAAPQLARHNEDPIAMSDDLTADFAALRTNVDGGGLLADRTLLAFLASWTQLFGLLSFELSSQTRGMVEHHRDLFDSSARLMATHMGLAEPN